MNTIKYNGKDSEDKEWFLIEYTELGMISFYERSPNFITSTIFFDKVINNTFYVYFFNNRISVAYDTELLDDIEAEEFNIVRTEKKIMFISSKRWIEFNEQ